jgi:dihydrofolate reductase
MKYIDFYQQLLTEQVTDELRLAEHVASLLEKNTPTDPDKWSKAKSAARAKFDVYPSAYANLWAAKKYKSMGGGWKRGKK